MTVSFDELRIPLRVAFGARGGPGFSTEIVTLDNGYERRNQNWAQARRRYDARTALHNAADAADLLAFFHARAGRARGFRLKDWSDFTSAVDGIAAPAFDDQTIGLGDGAATQFQLLKNYGSGSVAHARQIRKPVTGTVLIGLDGAPLASGWSVDITTGVVTFSVAPAPDAVITAGYEFDVPVRFDTDILSLTAEDFLAYQSEIPLVEIRV